MPNWILFTAAHLNRAMSGLLGYAPMLTPGKARELTQANWVCNNKALSTATGWFPEIGLEEGVHSLFETPAEPEEKT
jgi:nucleoside-diphosphate-sugar epimerase